MLRGNDRHDGTPFSVSAERNADMFIDLAHRRPDAPGDVLGHLIAYADTGVSQNFSDRLLRQPLRLDLDEPRRALDLRPALRPDCRQFQFHCHLLASRAR